MTAVEPNWPGALFFAALCITCCLGLLTVSGMLPLASRPDSAKGPGGLVLLACNLLLLAVLLVGTGLYGWQALRLTTVIVVVGLVVLFTPDLFQAWPAAWRDTRFGLSLLVLLQVMTLGFLYLHAGTSLVGRFS
jgi:hypothetical protein